jgi:hypothetical protein
VTIKQAEKMRKDELEGKILVGDFVEKNLQTLEDLYLKLGSGEQKN